MGFLVVRRIQKEMPRLSKKCMVPELVALPVARIGMKVKFPAFNCLSGGCFFQQTGRVLALFLP